jgi:hypothetical protein
MTTSGKVKVHANTGGIYAGKLAALIEDMEKLDGIDESMGFFSDDEGMPDAAEVDISNSSSENKDLDFITSLLEGRYIGGCWDEYRALK